jgi:toxin ParE1/3/4
LTRRLNIAPVAKAEIVGIWDYTATEYGVEAADQYVTDLDGIMLGLLDFPLLGEDCSGIRQGYHRNRARSHMFYYVPHKGGIEIMRVLGIRMDARSRLQE